MSKKGKSVTGRLFYTFGTIFFAAIFTICAMNFTKDARVFQEPLLSASTVNSTTDKAEAANKTLKYKKSTTATTSTTAKSKSSVNNAEKVEKTSVDQETTTDMSKNNPGNNP